MGPIQSAWSSISIKIANRSAKIHFEPEIIGFQFRDFNSPKAIHVVILLYDRAMHTSESEENMCGQNRS